MKTPKVLSGTPASKGEIEGVTRVIIDETQFSDFKPGEILVTRQTNPAWTPLFAAASGVVTEIGGALSHAAIVAREYGIPAVVGVNQAAKMIKTGQRIKINGQSGKIYFS